MARKSQKLYKIRRRRFFFPVRHASTSSLAAVSPSNLSISRSASLVGDDSKFKTKIVFIYSRKKKTRYVNHAILR